MLEHLFGSRTRVKLISLFMSQPDDPIFVREVTRRISTQINAVRRELANLMKFGLIREVNGTSDGVKRPGLKRKYYKLNDVFPLLPEVRALMTKAQLLVEHRVDKDLEHCDTVRYAALMGSFLGQRAAGTDLFIIGSIDKTLLDRIISKMEMTIGKEINYCIMSVQEYEYRKDMTDKFLYSLFDAPKNVVVDRLQDKKLVA
jgi:predicted transcriptional regulator